MMWIWKDCTARNGSRLPQASMAPPILGMCVSVLCMAFSRFLLCGTSANTAEDHRPGETSLTVDKGHVMFPETLLAQRNFKGPLDTTSHAGLTTVRGTVAPPATKAGPGRSVNGAQKEEQSARQSNSYVKGGNASTVEAPQVEDVPGLEKGNASSGLHQAAAERRYPSSTDAGDSSGSRGIAHGTPGLARLPKLVNNAADGTAVLQNYEPKTASPEQEVQENNDTRFENTTAGFLDGRSRFNTFNSYATSLTDKFAEKIATLTAQVDLLRMDVVRARDEVQRLNDAFDARTDETLRKIEEISTHFGADLSRLERQLEWQLNPRTGVVSKRIGELRQELLDLRVRARDMFEKEATVYVQQIESCSARVDSLTEIYFDLKSRTDLEVNEIESYMLTARRKLEDTMQEQLNILTETEREAAARASQRFKSFLKSLRLEGNVLQGLVKSIQRRFLEPQSTFANSGESSTRGATYIDMSGLFATSRVEKVCVVVTQLVKELLEGNVVVPIFIYSVSRRMRSRTLLAGGPSGSAARPAKQSRGKTSLFSRTFTSGPELLNRRSNLQNHPQVVSTKTKQSGRRDATGASHSTGFDASADPAVEMVLPNVEILEKAAALWLEERQEYGLSYDHYAVIRIEGYLMEYFTVPFLEYRPFSYATEDDFVTVNVEQFAATLKSAVEEKLSSLETGLQKHTYLLVAYLGEVAANEDVVRPRPSLVQTDSRVSLARDLTQKIKPRSPSMYFIFQYFQQMLHFTDQAEQLFKQGLKKRHALQSRLGGDDIRVLVVTDDCRAGTGDCSIWGAMTPKSREDDPFFSGTFAVLRLTLKQLAPDFLVFPSDYLLAVALDQLVWEVTGGSRIPGPLSLLHVPPDPTQGSADKETKKRDPEGPQGPRPRRRHTSGVLISTGGKAARGWSTATLTASLSLLEHRTRQEHGTPADTLGLIKKDAGSDDVTIVRVLKNSTQHAVRVSFSSTLEEVAKHTLSVTLRVMREKLDYLARGYTLYVYVNVT